MLRSLVVPLLAALSLVSGCAKTKPDCKGTAVVCGDTCVEPKSDNLNCGACGAVCDAGKVCSNGACTVTCAAGLVNCGGSCIDPLTDRAHCGASGACTAASSTDGAACADGQLCSAGSCVQTCSAAQAACPTSSPTYCADLTRDANNCGACGATCPAGQQCSTSGGVTACACPPSRPDACGTGAASFCTDEQNDPRNCGACGTTCGAGQVCSVGSCVQSCSTAQATACPAVNPTYCADTQTDANDCGGCGVVCEAGQQCSGGICSCPATTPDACTTGGGAKFCTSKDTDPLNCGACGTICAPGTACSVGTCVTSCPAGEVACAGECVDPQSDPDHCGASGSCTGAAAGSVCTPGAQACRAGACAPMGYVLPTTATDVRLGVTSALVDGTRAYVVEGTTFTVLDVSNPIAPVVLGSVVHGFTDLRVEPQVVHDGIVWCIRSSSGGYGAATYVFGVDVTNPAAPTLRGSLTLQTGTSLLSNTGSRLYAGYLLVHDYSRNLIYVIDIRNPSAPTVYSQFGVPNMVNGGPGTMLVDGDLLYLTCRENGTFRIYDLSTLTAVVQVGQVGLSGDASCPPVKIGQLVYVVDAAGLRTIDVAIPAAPTIVHTTPFGSAYLIGRNGKLFALDYGNTPTVRAFSLANPVAPALEAASTVTYSGPTTSLNIAPMAWWSAWVGHYLIGQTWGSSGAATGVRALNFDVY